MLFEMPQNLGIFRRISPHRTSFKVFQRHQDSLRMKLCLTKSYGKVIGPFNHNLGKDTRGKKCPEISKSLLAGIHNVRCTVTPNPLLVSWDFIPWKHLDYQGPRTKSMLWLFLCSSDFLYRLVREQYQCETAHFTILQRRMNHVPLQLVLRVPGSIFRTWLRILEPEEAMASSMWLRFCFTKSAVCFASQFLFFQPHLNHWKTYIQPINNKHGTLAVKWAKNIWSTVYIIIEKAFHLNKLPFKWWILRHSFSFHVVAGWGYEVVIDA